MHWARGCGALNDLDSSNYLDTKVLLRAADGMQLFTQSWRRAGGAHAAVAITHRVAEHSSCDQHGTGHPARRSYKVEALEVSGHARSVSRTSPQTRATVYTRIACEAMALHCASWSGALCFTLPRQPPVFFPGSRCRWDQTRF